jgi:hypothetical protein
LRLSRMPPSNHAKPHPRALSFRFNHVSAFNTALGHSIAKIDGS